MTPIVPGYVMNTQSARKILVVGLGLWLLVVTTALASPMTGHAMDHGHHTQQSHSQPWCDWMCKASHAIHTPSVSLVQSYDVLTSAYRPPHTHHQRFLVSSANSRAPPPSSLS